MTPAVSTLVPERPADAVAPGTPAALRPATAGDADAIHALIGAHQADGHLLPRRRDEVAAHATRFFVAVRGARIVGCAELAPLGRTVAEVRSLVVESDTRGDGLGQRLVDALRTRAVDEGFETLCAFTHAPRFFARLGFSIVPHEWLPGKIAADCAACPLFRRCGQYAMLQPLRRAPQVCVPLTALHG